MIPGLARLIRTSLLADRPVASLLAAVTMTYLGLGIVIPIRALYAREIGLSLAGIGVMASSFLLFNTLGQVPFGWLTDRVGRRWPMAIGVAVEVGIALLYVVLTEAWSFIVLRALEGLAAAMISPAARAYIADVAPEERRGEAYALLGAAFNGGILLGPAIGGWLSAATDYQAAFAVSAAVRLVGLALLLALVREPARHLARAVAGAPAAGWRAAVSRRLLGGYLVGLGFGFANGLFFALWSLWLQDLGASSWLIGLTFTAFALPSLLLAPLAGRLSDRVGRLPLLLGPGLVDVTIYTCLGLTSDLALIMALCVVQGAIAAFIMPALDGLIADASPAEGRGRVQGLYAGITFAGSFLSSLICTVLYGWSRPAPFILVTAVVLLMLALGTPLLLHRRRQP